MSEIKNVLLPPQKVANKIGNLKTSIQQNHGICELEKNYTNSSKEARKQLERPTGNFQAKTKFAI